MINPYLNYKLSLSRRSIFYIKNDGIKQDKETLKCYKSPKIFEWVYHIYIMVIAPPAVFFLYLYLRFDTVISIIISILSYLTFEFILIFFVPLERIDCEDNIK